MNFNCTKSVGYILLFSVLFFAQACHKNTKADFKLDRYEYAAGEQLDITNYSKSDVWSVTNPENEVIEKYTKHNPAIVIDLFATDGVYKLGLYDNTTELAAGVGETKEFIVKTIRTELEFHGSNDFEEFTAYIDGVEVGKSNTTGRLDVDIPIGMRVAKVVNANGYEESKTIIISKDEWNKVYFY